MQSDKIVSQNQWHIFTHTPSQPRRKQIDSIFILQPQVGQNKNLTRLRKDSVQYCKPFKFRSHYRPVTEQFLACCVKTRLGVNCSSEAVTFIAMALF